MAMHVLGSTVCAMPIAPRRPRASRSLEITQWISLGGIAWWTEAHPQQGLRQGPGGQGLGITLNEEAIKQHLV